jgi:hypothetical protein
MTTLLNSFLGPVISLQRFLTPLEGKTKLCFLITIIFCCFSSPSSLAEQETNQIPFVQLAHAKNDEADWWHGAGLEIAESGDLYGNGRVLVYADKGKAARFKTESVNVKLSPKSLVFLDAVGQQVRVMVLRGRVEMTTPLRKVNLSVSQQGVYVPPQPPKLFINDGIYRRTPALELTESGAKLVVRDFYLEQMVYSDPILRTLYDVGGSERKMIEKINKAGAIVRDLNGLTGYDAQQL